MPFAVHSEVHYSVVSLWGFWPTTPDLSPSFPSPIPLSPWCCHVGENFEKCFFAATSPGNFWGFKKQSSHGAEGIIQQVGLHCSQPTRVLSLASYMVRHALKEWFLGTESKISPEHCWLWFKTSSFPLSHSFYVYYFTLSHFYHLSSWLPLMPARLTITN